MNTHITAIYEGGLLRPNVPLPIPDGAKVEVIVVTPPSSAEGAKPLAEAAVSPAASARRLPDLIPSDEISAPCDLPRSSEPELVAAYSGKSRLPDPLDLDSAG